MTRPDEEIPAAEAENGAAPAGPAAAGSGPSAGARTEAPPPPTPAEFAALREKAAQRDDFQDRWLRVNAELQNLQRRIAREKDLARKLAMKDLLQNLLPSFDNLARALASGAADPATVLVGVRMVHGEIHRVLADCGVQTIAPGRERFDANVHEAILKRHEPGVEENTVLEVHEKGYRLGDLVIRPARVVVAAPEPQKSE